MALSKERNQIGNSLAWNMPPALTNPMMAIFTDVTGTVLEGLATAQKDWADFVQKRIRENVAVTRQLVNCHSLVDMQNLYSEYLHGTFRDYREQSEKAIQRNQSIAQHLAETTEANVKDVVRARHN
jgi:hypothetical protein